MRALLFGLLCVLLAATAHAEIVRQVVRPGITASAEYLPGERAQPAVMLVHGFLQTREFPTVANLARGLHDTGYPVLTPTLSLNIPNRKQSLACEAAHKHSMDDDVAEIARWVAWLKARGHERIVLLGHSFGSLQALAYLAGKPDPAVKGYLGISLIEAQIGDLDRPRLIAQLETQAAAGQHKLVSHSLSFCRKYLSPPLDLLSYARWDQPRVLAALKQARVPVRLIMGDLDDLIGESWMRALRHIDVPLVIIAGANHFLDGQHEFDLLEHSLRQLDSLNRSLAR